MEINEILFFLGKIIQGGCLGIITAAVWFGAKELIEINCSLKSISNRLDIIEEAASKTLTAEDTLKVVNRKLKATEKDKNGTK